TKTTKGKITSLTQNPLCGTYLHPGQFSMEIPGHFSAEIYNQWAWGGCSSRPLGAYAPNGTGGERAARTPVIGLAREKGYIGNASCADSFHAPT
ncbi:hypothetical protein, partial [Sphingomonas sp. DC1600-2]|uniref:hypothetical protein n=1 Tax=unclassified Sphingomonas TaxID=196159 RepID=UPI003CF1F51D